MRVFSKPPPRIKCTDNRDSKGRPQLMSKACKTCKSWILIEGTNPNTGKDMAGYVCEKTAMVLMQMETTQMVRQMDAAVTAKIKEVGDKITGAIVHGTKVQIAIADEQRRVSVEGKPLLMLQDAKQ